MASSTTTSPSIFSSDTVVAANRENKRVATGYPLLARPGDPHVVFTASYRHFRTPPPPPPPPIYFRHHHRKDQLCFHHFAAAASCFFSFIGCLLFTIWFFLTPCLPDGHLASATISSLSVTATTDASIACKMSLLLTNSNRKFTIFYDRLELFAVYKPHKVPLFKTQVLPFVQPEKNDTVLHAQMEISDQSIGKDVLKALKGDLVRGSISFGVKFFVLMRLKSQESKTRSHLVKIYCDNVILGSSSSNGPGNMINPSKDCRVDM